jgi:hypothetical protein
MKKEAGHRALPLYQKKKQEESFQIYLKFHENLQER